MVLEDCLVGKNQTNAKKEFLKFLNRNSEKLEEFNIKEKLEEFWNIFNSKGYITNFKINYNACEKIANEIRRTFGTSSFSNNFIDSAIQAFGENQEDLAIFLLGSVYARVAENRMWKKRRTLYTPGINAGYIKGVVSEKPIDFPFVKDCLKFIGKKYVELKREYKK